MNTTAIIKQMEALLDVAESQERDFTAAEAIQWKNFERRLFLLSVKTPKVEKR